ncbi:MAG: DUF4037 domain-containing protein [Lachnospiraceae bacterium]|nr:DUF4037 domain-containing protein [Lachnospiraceae bacterium]
MNGLQLAKDYFEQFGMPMLKEQFPEQLSFLAAGMCGSGSQCLGYDDEVSEDHDFGPGFLLFLPGEEIVDRRTAFLMERAYSRLPKEFRGYRTGLLSPVGGPRCGVIRIPDFIKEKTGTEDGILTLRDWLTVPEQSLLEAVNGEIYFDNYGAFTRLREQLSYYPEDIRRKKLAGHLLLMAQSGQYNYRRCLLHGETGAAQLAVHEFVQSAMHVIFLLNRRYRPFYKWSFRALRSLPLLSLEDVLFEYLLTSDNGENAEEKYNVMEGIASDIIDVLTDQALTKAICGDLEKHAYSVNDGISDASLRNMHILAGIGPG